MYWLLSNMYSENFDLGQEAFTTRMKGLPGCMSGVLTMVHMDETQSMAAILPSEST